MNRVSDGNDTIAVYIHGFELVSFYIPMQRHKLLFFFDPAKLLTNCYQGKFPIPTRRTNMYNSKISGAFGAVPTQFKHENFISPYSGT